MVELNIRKKLRAAWGIMELHLQTEIPEGQILGVTGPSGSGKTSLLRMVAGLLKPEEGIIRAEGKVWQDSQNQIFLPPQDRPIGFVFQDYALFPNMTVSRNLKFALPKGYPSSIVQELIIAMELEELAHRYPQQLSGGQQQRVALARALVRQPQVFLLDEPLSALDRKLRERLQSYILEAHSKYGLTTILVSHDEQQVRKMADRVILLENGKIARDGKPEIILPEN